MRNAGEHELQVCVLAAFSSFYKFLEENTAAKQENTSLTLIIKV